MSKRQDEGLAALAAGARLLARGGDLDDQLDGLASGACSLSAATSAVVYLLDGEHGVLVAGGTAGLGDLADHPIEPLSMVETTDADPASRAVRARRSELVLVTSEMTSLLAGRSGGIAAMALVPLVTQDAGGSQEVQGLLVAGLPRLPGDAEAALAGLASIGDLAAAAIRAARLERALAERSDWYDRVAHTDPLTGLANRRTFERMLELELARAGRQGSPVSLTIFDVDGLAEISAGLGDDVGDDVLRRVASTLADSVRLVDTVARFGGDEFIVLAPGSAGKNVAQRIVDAVGRLDPIDGGGAISLSAGVVRFPDHGANAEELLGAAGAALREAKATGPGTVIVRG